MAESERGPNVVRELDALRIARSAQPERRSRLLPALAGVVGVGVLATAGYEIYRHTLGRPPEVETAVVMVKSAGQPGEMLSGSGYVITRAKYITIGTKILGQIVNEPIEEGQHVRKGDLLAQIDDRDYKAQLAQAIAQRDLAVANLRLQEAKLRRSQELFRNSYLSQNELDIAQNATEVARAEVKRTSAEIDYAQFNVDQCRIVSPIDGVVLQKYREAGATINYGGEIQAGGGTTDIAQLADTDDMRVEVDINESDIAKASIGMPATIVPDAYPDRSFEGKVVKIYPEANRQKGTVKVEVRFDAPDMKIIKPEMSAKVVFLASASSAQSQPLILLPKKAAVNAAGNAAWVWVVRDGVTNRVPVVLGREFQGGVEVKQGLSGGEIVIVSPPDTLKDGANVVAKPS
jgi:RND family efflux transporter MFP subunit